MSSEWFPWCTGYYTREFCKEKIAELKAQGKEAKIGGSTVDTLNGKRYYRVLIKRSQI